MELQLSQTHRVFVGGPIKHAIQQGDYDEELRVLILSVLSSLTNDGCEVFSAHLTEGFGLDSSATTSYEITRRDFDWMRRCDIFVAILPAGLDGALRTDGTHVELGWASALSKPIVAVVPLPLPENYGHLLHGLECIAKVCFVDISDVQKDPTALTKVVKQQRQNGYSDGTSVDT